MDPGARAALIVGLGGACAVGVAGAFLAPIAPLLAATAGMLAGWLHVRYTRLEIPKRPGQGGWVVAPPIVLAQVLGTALDLFLLEGGVRLGARLTHLGAGSLDLPVPMALALIVLVALLDLALVLVGAEWAARRALARRRDAGD